MSATRPPTAEEIKSLLALAAPPEGEAWSAFDIAEVLAKAALETAKAQKAEDDAWEQGRKGLRLQLQPSGVRPGNPEAEFARQDAAEAAVRRAVDQKIASNMAVISMAGTTAFTLATAAMGGAGLPALIPQAMGAATQIAAAFNGPDKEPPPA